LVTKLSQPKTTLKKSASNIQTGELHKEDLRNIQTGELHKEDLRIMNINVDLLMDVCQLNEIIKRIGIGNRHI
jgi:hypothetical protein